MECTHAYFFNYRVKCQPMPTYETSLLRPNQAYETNGCFIQSLLVKQDNLPSELTSKCRL